MRVAQVVFDRFDHAGAGALPVADARAALEYMGRDVNTEACAAWLVDMRKRGSTITFVDFTTA